MSTDKTFESVNPGGVVAVTWPYPEPVSVAVAVSAPALMVTGEVIVAPAMSVTIAIDTGESPPANCSICPNTLPGSSCAMETGTVFPNTILPEPSPTTTPDGVNVMDPVRERYPGALAV